MFYFLDFFNFKSKFVMYKKGIYRKVKNKKLEMILEAN